MAVLNEPAIRAAAVAVINGLGFGAVVMAKDAVNMEMLRRFDIGDPDIGVIDGITVEIGDDQTQRQFDTSRVGLRGDEEMGGSYRIDWMHTIRIYMDSNHFGHEEVTQRAVSMLEAFLAQQSLGGTVRLMWAPPRMIEIDNVAVSEDLTMWFGAMTIGWSSFVDVTES